MRWLEKTPEEYCEKCDSFYTPFFTKCNCATAKVNIDIINDAIDKVMTTLMNNKNKKDQVK